MKVEVFPVHGHCVCKTKARRLVKGALAWYGCPCSNFIFMKLGLNISLGSGISCDFSPGGN